MCCSKRFKDNIYLCEPVLMTRGSYSSPESSLFFYLSKWESFEFAANKSPMLKLDIIELSIFYFFSLSVNSTLFTGLYFLSTIIGASLFLGSLFFVFSCIFLTAPLIESSLLNALLFYSLGFPIPVALLGKDFYSSLNLAILCSSKMAAYLLRSIDGST